MYYLSRRIEKKQQKKTTKTCTNEIYNSVNCLTCDYFVTNQMSKLNHLTQDTNKIGQHEQEYFDKVSATSVLLKDKL